MKRCSALVVAGLLAFTGPAFGQTQVGVKLTAPNAPGGTPVPWTTSWTTASGGTASGSFYVSPYTGVLTATNQTVVLNCVDFFHEAYIGVPYTAYKTDLSSSSLASYSRFGSLTDGATLYLEAAWLSLQYSSPNPGSTPNRTIAIQAAIWNLFTGRAPDKYSTTNDLEDETYWMGQAATHYTSIDASEFYLLTPTDFKTNLNSGQEFLVYNPNGVTTTPEPATLALLGTGMAFVGGFARRRRRKGPPTV